MKAAVLETPGTPFVFTDIDIAEPRAGEVRVAIHHCGLCHSDVAIADGTHMGPAPAVLGHEASGVIEAVGPGVDHLTVGDRVIVTPAPSCGRCYWCVRGEYSICEYSLGIITGMLPDGTSPLTRNGEMVFRGVGVGGFAEAAVVVASAVVKIPDDVPLDVVCVIGCAMQTGVGAVLNTAKVPAGSTVLVMGAGGIGSAIVQGARIAGASRIIVSDPNESRRETAQQFVATDLIDPTSDDVGAAVLSLTGVGADYAFDAVGLASLVETGLAATRSGGMTVMVGAPPIDQNVNLNVVMAMIMEKKLVGSMLGSCHAPRDIPMMIDLWRSGVLDLEGMITHRRPLEELNEAMADMHNGIGLRTVINLR